MGIAVPEELRVRGPAEASPQRRPWSVRRTSTIDMRWPAGWGTQLRLEGRARDLFTPDDGGEPVVLAEDALHAGVHPATRTIEDIASEPERRGLERLVGVRGGGKLRGALADIVPEEREAGSPLYLLLDDIAGATLIAGFAFSQWVKPERMLAALNSGDARPPKRDMTGICTGFMPGSGALMPDGSPQWNHNVRSVNRLPRQDDPFGWHHMEEITDVSMRRARRVDVRVGDVIEIDSMFQDSSTVPEGGRVAVHEYRVAATASPETGELLSLTADPRVLPYNECPLASANVGTLIGTPLPELREVVLERLKGTSGCTHLNDAMRALAEVPRLAAALRR